MSGSYLQVIDTATRRPIVGLAGADGTLKGARQWQSAQRHNEELLAQLDGLLNELAVRRTELAGVIVGTGPGSFTGLRIGLAAAKVIAYSLGCPLVGVSSTRALALAAAQTGPVAVVLPAGAADRYVHVLGPHGEELEAPRIAAAADAGAPPGATLVAVDIDAPAAPVDAVRLGELAQRGLAAALAVLGAAALREGQTVDPATLVPAYIALPRGIARAVAEMQWSPDLR